MIALLLACAVFVAECATMVAVMAVGHIHETSAWWILPFAIVALFVGVLTERHVRV